MTGTIKTLRVDKGFGFIRDAAGKEVFFHASAIYGEGIDNLREGDGVEFELGDGGARGPRATNVRRTTTWTEARPARSLNRSTGAHAPYYDTPTLARLEAREPWARS